jgi:SAM-dependent methyltransferase
MSPTDDSSPRHQGSYEPTSERLSEADYQSNAADFLIYCCHLATYDFVRPMVAGRHVLDFGCGTGYGTHRLAADAAEIVGVDISASAIELAQATYRADGLRYEQIRPLPDHPAPFPDASFDVIVSFQVVEHIWAVESYVDELDRLLAPDGVVVVATPDRTTRLFRGQRPWNRFHVIEYDGDGLRAALLRRFPDVVMHHMTATSGVEDIELRRSKQMRLLTYPFTFPGAPEGWRQRGLRALKWIQSKRRGSATEVRTFDFGVEDVEISTEVRPSMNLIAVARR